MYCLIIDRNLRPDDAAEVKNVLTREGIGFIECTREDIPKHRDADFIIVLGGDGSVLGVSRQALEADLPILSINHGTLGYLSQLECGEAEAIASLKNGFSVEKRMTISCEVIRNGATVASFTALNEISATKGGMSRLFDVELMCNGSSVTLYRADGVIVSTPTGSTAYNLSAGGPVIDSSLEVLTVCPVCSHSLSGQRALVFAPDAVIELKPSIHSGCKAYLTADGRDYILLATGDTVRITRGEKYQKFVRMKENAFHDVLKNKLLNAGG